MRRLLTDSARIATGEVAGAIAWLMAVALAARSLGPESFGQFVLVLAYGATIDLLINFQSARAVVRYGAHASGINPERLAPLVRFCRVIDGAAAATAATIAVVAAPSVAKWLGVESAWLLTLYGGLLVFNVSGHAYGVLRLVGRFGFLASHAALFGALRLLGVGLGLIAPIDSLVGAVLGVALAETLARMILIWRSAREVAHLRMPRLRSGWYGDLRRTCPDIVSFAVLSNLSDTVLKAVQQADVFIVGSILSTESAGYYRLVKVVSSPLVMAASAFGQVVYPHMARISTVGGILRIFVVRSVASLSLGGGGVLLVYAFVGQALLDVVFGPAYADIFTPSLVYMVGAVLGVGLTPLTPLYLVRGLQRALLMAYLGSSMGYVAVLVLGAALFGLSGAAWAMLALYACYASITFFIFQAIRSSNGH